MENKTTRRRVGYSVDGFTWQGIEALNRIHEALDGVYSEFAPMLLDEIYAVRTEYDKVSDLFNAIAKFESDKVDMLSDISNKYVASKFDDTGSVYAISTINQFKKDSFLAARKLGDKLTNLINQFNEEDIFEDDSGELIGQYNELACNLNSFFDSYMTTIPDWTSMGDRLDIPLIFFDEDV
ncbi:hypothetical protein KW882_05465 [Vibrio parahaemolyticus]